MYMFYIIIKTNCQNVHLTTCRGKKFHFLAVSDLVNKDLFCFAASS